MLTNKTAVITGGIRGIGRAIAEKFCENGADVMLIYRSNDEEAAKTAADLEKYGTRIHIFKGDVADHRTAVAAAQQLRETFGKVDILVNNAGITNDKLMMRMSSEDFDKVIAANLSGAFYMMKEMSQMMIKRRSGVIINMSSVSGLKGNPAQINYSASKAGIVGMTLSAAKELGRRGIRANAIAPGFIETDMTAALTDKQREAAAANITLGRMGKPEDIANTALFLASDMSAYITGQVISVDGGIIM